MFNTFLRRLDDWHIRRRTMKVLDRLDDHLLRDIGLCRSEGQYYPTCADKTRATVDREMWIRVDLLRSPDLLGWKAVHDAIAPAEKATAMIEGRQKPMQQRRGAYSAVVRQAA